MNTDTDPTPTSGDRKCSLRSAIPVSLANDVGSADLKIANLTISHGNGSGSADGIPNGLGGAMYAGDNLALTLDNGDETYCGTIDAKAAFKIVPQSLTAPETVRFNANQSSPKDQLVAYDWTFGDGTTDTGLLVDHTFDTPGIYNVKLRVTDAVGKTGVKWKKVSIFGTFAWQPPLIIRPGRNHADAGTQVDLAFSIGGDLGLDIMADGSPTFQLINCNTGDPVSAPHAAHQAQALSFDDATQTYTFHWRTYADWAGSCRQFQVTLKNGVTRALDFTFPPADQP